MFDDTKRVRLSDIDDIDSDAFHGFLWDLFTIVTCWHEQGVDCYVGKRTCRFSLYNGSWVHADDTFDFLLKTENMIRNITDWLINQLSIITYLGEKFELRWCDQNIGSHTSWEHHLGILLPLNWCSLITWVQWVKSALLEDWLDTFLDLATLKSLVVSGCAQVLNDISIDDSEGHLVYSEHLWVG